MVATHGLVCVLSRVAIGWLESRTPVNNQLSHNQKKRKSRCFIVRRLWDRSTFKPNYCLMVCGYSCESDSKMQYHRPFDNKFDGHRCTIVFNYKIIKDVHFPLEQKKHRLLVPNIKHAKEYVSICNWKRLLWFHKGNHKICIQKQMNFWKEFQRKSKHSRHLNQTLTKQLWGNYDSIVSCM